MKSEKAIAAQESMRRAAFAAKYGKRIEKLISAYEQALQEGQAFRIESPHPHNLLLSLDSARQKGIEFYGQFEETLGLALILEHTKLVRDLQAVLVLAKPVPAQAKVPIPTQPKAELSIPPEASIFGSGEEKQKPVDTETNS